MLAHLSGVQGGKLGGGGRNVTQMVCVREKNLRKQEVMTRAEFSIVPEEEVCCADVRGLAAEFQCGGNGFRAPLVEEEKRSQVLGVRRMPFSRRDACWVEAEAFVLHVSFWK